MSQVKPYKDTEAGKKEQVTEMFDNISGNYDALNRVITFGMDISWRKNVFKIVKKQEPQTILDIATGTGDMAILYAQTNAEKIVGLDISSGMLEVAKTKTKKKNLEDVIEYKLGDAEHLPFEDASFDCLTIGFGLRNVTDKDQALREMCRVLRPGGVLLVLEFSHIENPLLRQAYQGFQALWPAAGKALVNDADSYKYLVESIRVHPKQNQLKLMIKDAGFTDVSVDNLVGGAAAIHRATVPLPKQRANPKANQSAEQTTNP